MCVTTGSMTLIPDSQRIYLTKAFSFNRFTPAGLLALPLHQKRQFLCSAEDQIIDVLLLLLFLCIVHQAVSTAVPLDKLGLFVVQHGLRFSTAATLARKGKEQKVSTSSLVQKACRVLYAYRSGKGLMKKFCKPRFTLEGVI